MEIDYDESILSLLLGADLVLQVSMCLNMGGMQSEWFPSKGLYKHVGLDALEFLYSNASLRFERYVPHKKCLCFLATRLF